MLLTLFKRMCFFFPFVKQCLETEEIEMTWSQPIIVRECISKNRTCISRHVKGLKRFKPNLTSVKKQRKLWIVAVFLFVNV